MYLLLCKESKFSFYSFLFFSFGKHHVVRKYLGTYVQLNIDSMSYYCWHHPWGEYAGMRNYKPLSFYVSGWNVLLMCMRWVLAIIEDYMMVEYVDSPKGSDTWPFLKRWWIVVAKLTELSLIHEKYMIKVPSLIFFAVIIINMMLLCPYFVFIDTSLSKHVDMFFDFGFHLRTSEV